MFTCLEELCTLSSSREITIVRPMKNIYKLVIISYIKEVIKGNLSIV